MHIEYTKWDHYRWSYRLNENVRTAETVPPDECFYRSWFTGGITRPVESFRHECLTTANLLYERALEQGVPVRVMVSGGADSEVVAWAFKLAGVPFSLAFMNFENDLNRPEREAALRLAESLGMRLDVLDVDIHKIAKWAETQSRSGYQAPISYAHRYLALSFPKELAVWGCGDVVMVRGWDDVVYAQFGSARHHSYDIYTCEDNDLIGTEQFLCYTPEQALSQYAHPIFRSWVDSPKSMPWYSSYGMKIAMYKTEFPEIRSDQTKRTGAELIRAFEATFIDARQHLAPYCVRPLVRYEHVITQLTKPGETSI